MLPIILKITKKLQKKLQKLQKITFFFVVCPYTTKSCNYRDRFCNYNDFILVEGHSETIY